MTTLRVPGAQADRSHATRTLPATARRCAEPATPGLSIMFSTAPEFSRMKRMPAMSTNWSVTGIPCAWSIQPPVVRESVPRAWL
jgi:hypothetical protein